MTDVLACPDGAASQAASGAADVLGVHDPVGVALLGQEALALGREVLVQVSRATRE